MAYLSCDLGTGSSSSHGGGGRKPPRSRGCEEGHWWRHSLAYPQVLTPQVKEIHGGHGVLSRLALIIFYRENDHMTRSFCTSTSFSPSGFWDGDDCWEVDTGHAPLLAAEGSSHYCTLGGRTSTWTHR